MSNCDHCGLKHRHASTYSRDLDACIDNNLFDTIMFINFKLDCTTVFSCEEMHRSEYNSPQAQIAIDVEDTEKFIEFLLGCGLHVNEYKMKYSVLIDGWRAVDVKWIGIDQSASVNYMYNDSFDEIPTRTFFYFNRHAMDIIKKEI